jgi:MFS family permease
MNTRKQIEALFSGYEKTAELADFTEELESNLNDRIASLMRKGLAEQEAANKVLAELGDISLLADELSLKKKQEVFSEMYMETRNYISPKRSALYALCGLVLGAGILIPLLVWFASGIMLELVATMLPFSMAGILGFVYLGLTQETATHEAMRGKRALWYVLAAGLILFGILAALITYLGVEFTSLSAEELAAHGAPDSVSMLAAIAILIAFILPGIALGVFLTLTEKDRSKPWVIKRREEHMKYANEEFGSPAAAQKFGLICGALWIAAIACFILLTITIGIKFSWLAIVVALVTQMLVMAGFTKGGNKK